MAFRRPAADHAAARVDYDLIGEGLAATSDVDNQRMKFRPWAFEFLPRDKPLLLYRHLQFKPAGEVLDMRHRETETLRHRLRPPSKVWGLCER